MKKTIITTIIAIILIICSISFCGCDLLFGSDDLPYEPLPDETDVTVHFGDETVTAVATFGKHLTIPAKKTPEGKYLKGYYNSESGGTIYFNYLGQSLDESWKRDSPTEFYAQYGDINSLSLDFRSEVDKRICAVYNQAEFKFEVPGEFVIAAKQYPDKDVKVELTFEMVAQDHTMESKILHYWISFGPIRLPDRSENGAGEEEAVFKGTDHHGNNVDYKTVTKVGTFKASRVQPRVYTSFETTGNLAYGYYVKNVHAKFSFVDDTTDSNTTTPAN